MKRGDERRTCARELCYLRLKYQATFHFPFHDLFDLPTERSARGLGYELKALFDLQLPISLDNFAKEQASAKGQTS